MNAAFRQGIVEQVYIKTKCGHSKLLDPLYFRHLSCFTIFFPNMQNFGVWTPFQNKIAIFFTVHQ